LIHNDPEVQKNTSFALIQRNKNYSLSSKTTKTDEMPQLLTTPISFKSIKTINIEDSPIVAQNQQVESPTIISNNFTKILLNEITTPTKSLPPQD
jgi:hypothetical protein